jgi:outer membrane protein assembly factor BamB
MRFLILGICLFLGAAPKSAVAQAASTEWPQFLGPTRDGKSSDTDLVEGWRIAGLRERWRVPVGEGFAGITTTAGVVFSMDSVARDEFVFALDAEDGTELWRSRSGHSPSGNYGGAGPRVTPTVDGEQVLTVSAEGRLFALDTERGAVLWRRDLRDELAWRPPAEGTASTPLVVGNRIYLVVGGGPEKTVGAFDLRTGKTLWSAGNDRTSYASPVLWTVEGIAQVLFLTGSRLSAHDPTNGNRLWSYEWPTYDAVNVATPILVGPNRLFISAGYDQGGAVLQVHKAGQSLSVTEVWRNRVMKNHFNNSVHHDGVLYGFDNAIFKAVDSETGKQLWRARGFGKGSLILAGGYLIVFSDDGELSLAQPDRNELEVLDQVEVLDGLTWTPPSLAYGRLYLRNQEEIVCLEPDRSSK